MINDCYEIYVLHENNIINKKNNGKIYLDFKNIFLKTYH
jgi:hypothetical protein